MVVAIKKKLLVITNLQHLSWKKDRISPANIGERIRKNTSRLSFSLDPKFLVIQLRRAALGHLLFVFIHLLLF